MGGVRPTSDVWFRLHGKYSPSDGCRPNTVCSSTHALGEGNHLRLAALHKGSPTSPPLALPVDRWPQAPPAPLKCSVPRPRPQVPLQAFVLSVAAAVWLGMAAVRPVAHSWRTRAACAGCYVRSLGYSGQSYRVWSPWWSC
eukprot:scaffold597_cov242-Prasinococcus_capsulatus_cf.AAC.4